MTDSTDVQLAVAIEEIERLRARILELEAAAALTHGTLAKPTPDDPPAIVQNYPPSAPPHNE